MSEKDIAVQPSYNVPSGGTLLSKPCYLVQLTSGHLFLALELPGMEMSCMKVKGTNITSLCQTQTKTTATKDHIDYVRDNYADIVKQMMSNKKQIVECYFPWHQVAMIQNLVFVAK